MKQCPLHILPVLSAWHSAFSFRTHNLPLALLRTHIPFTASKPAFFPLHHSHLLHVHFSWGCRDLKHATVPPLTNLSSSKGFHIIPACCQPALFYFCFTSHFFSCHLTTALCSSRVVRLELLLGLAFSVSSYTTGTKSQMEWFP